MSLRAGWAQALYSAAWALALPVVFARFWWRGRAEPAYRHAWAQRLGFWPRQPAPTPQAPRVWVHAVSLGETRAAQPLIEALRESVPGMQLLLTTGTATGLEAGRAHLKPGDLHGWVPLDTAGATRRFMRTLQPQVGVLMETETWPNLLLQAERAGVPMVLANARLSARSLRKGQRWAALSRAMMQRLSAVCAQTEPDARHLHDAGVPAERICVSGNLKYGLQPSQALQAMGRQWAGLRAAPGAAGSDADAVAAWGGQAFRRRVVMAASWREGEDQPLLQAWLEALTRMHAGAAHDSPERPLLLLVPRHPQRFDEVQAALLRAGLSVSRRSSWAEGGPGQADWQADVWLGDSVGEMPAYYAAADVALLGGSFAPLGGQNLIEAAACACPVVMGPHTFNFEEAAQQAEEEGAALRAANLSQAVHLALQTDPARLEALRAAGLAWVAANEGAAQRQASAVRQALQEGHSSRSG
ncbi:MAG: 3-deoxy-D-manno-octulosonic acid transferase [Betaproteobacteria bacterium]|nr:3-deoxy-D-manno-octulosonic acid transferase [Betaproteobacteria bacterium]